MPATLRVSPYVLLTLSPLFWAGNWIIGRGLHADIPPMAMTFFRWLFAIVILAPFAWRHVKRDWPILRTHWKFLVVLGAIGVGTHNSLAYLGLNYTTATNGVILNSFIPVIDHHHIAITVIIPARIDNHPCIGRVNALTFVPRDIDAAMNGGKIEPRKSMVV